MIKHSFLNHVTTLVICRPESRNALNWKTIKELADGISDAENDADCHCLVITGDGNHFVAGRDLGETKSDASLNETLANDEAYTQIFTTLRSMTKPSVSVVRGYAVAGGFTLAMGCDFVLADRTAKFGALEMRGGFPAAVNTAILSHLVGPRQSLELLLSADMFDSEHLYRIGLINKIFDGSDKLEAGAKVFANNLAALDTLAVQMTKETQRATTKMPIADALIMAKHLNALLMSSGRINEAAKFFEKNKKRMK